MEQEAGKIGDENVLRREQASIADDKSLEKDKFSIFNYFKKHPAAILAATSCCIAIVTFFAQLLAYIVSKNTLEYWGFDPRYVSLSNNSLLYSSLASVVYIAMLSLADSWFSKTSDVYIEKKRHYLASLLFLKKYYKICNENRKQIAELSPKAHTFEKELCEIEKSVELQREEIAAFKKEICRSKRKAHLFFLINVLPILLLMSVFAFLLSYMVSPRGDLLKSVLLIVFIQTITCAVQFFVESRVKVGKRKIRKEISCKPIAEVMKDKECTEEYPIIALLVKGKGVSNAAFFLQIISLLLVFTILVITYALSIPNLEKGKTDFQMTTIDGELYAVVYYADNVYYLEGASIEEKSLEIFTRRQRIVSTSDISLTVQTFDKIIKNDNEDSP